jgi:hypothetical protein
MGLFGRKHHKVIVAPAGGQTAAQGMGGHQGMTTQQTTTTTTTTGAPGGMTGAHRRGRLSRLLCGSAHDTTGGPITYKPNPRHADYAYTPQRHY